MFFRKLPVGADEFAQGLVRYADTTEKQGMTRSNIVLAVTLGNTNPLLTTALVDTGAVYCIIDPEIAEMIDIDYWGDRGERNIGGSNYEGRYGRTTIALEAEDGNGIALETSVWVPELVYGQLWPHPNILGYSSFLKNLRFAVDPENNLFYFGSLGAEPY